MWNSMRIESKQNHLQQILELTNLRLNLNTGSQLYSLFFKFFFLFNSWIFELFLQVLGAAQ